MGRLTKTSHYSLRRLSQDREEIQAVRRRYTLLRKVALLGSDWLAIPAIPRDLDEEHVSQSSETFDNSRMSSRGT